MAFPFNQDQLAGIARIVVTAVCTWLAAKGFSAFGDTGIQGQVAAVVVAIAAMAWSFYSHTDVAKIEAAAAVDPGIKITVPPQVTAKNAGIEALVQNPAMPNITGERTV